MSLVKFKEFQVEHYCFDAAIEISFFYFRLCVEVGASVHISKIENANKSTVSRFFTENGLLGINKRKCSKKVLEYYKV